MKILSKNIAGFAIAASLSLGMFVFATQAETLRIALAETPSDETAAFFVQWTAPKP